MNGLNTRKNVGELTTADEVRASVADYSATLIIGDADQWIKV
jgi:hypothetical protein